MSGHEADHRRNASEHERLAEHLRDDPVATGSEGTPHDELALARRGAREQEKGDISADEHDQHETSLGLGACKATGEATEGEAGNVKKSASRGTESKKS